MNVHVRFELSWKSIPRFYSHERKSRLYKGSLQEWEGPESSWKKFSSGGREALWIILNTNWNSRKTKRDFWTICYNNDLITLNQKLPRLVYKKSIYRFQHSLTGLGSKRYIRTKMWKNNVCGTSNKLKYHTLLFFATLQLYEAVTTANLFSIFTT